MARPEHRDDARAWRQALGSRTSIVLSENVINALFALLTYAVIVRITDLATVGLWAMVSSVMGLARSVDVWSRGVSAFVAEARVTDGDGAAATYVSTAAISGAAGYALVTLAAAPLLLGGLGLALDAGAERALADILPLMLAGFWLTSMSGIYQLGFLGFERPGFKAVQTIGGSVIFLVGTVVLAPHYGLSGMIIAQIIQGIAMLLFAVAVFHIGMLGRRRIQLFDRQKVVQLVTFGSKAIGLGAMQLSTEPILRVIANHFGGLAGVALVDFASRLCQVPRTLVGAIGQTMVPAFARTARGSPAVQEQLFNRARAIVVPLSSALMMAVVGAAYLAGWVFIGETDITLALVTALLAAGWWVNLATSTEYFRFFGRRNLRVLTGNHVVMIAAMLMFGWAGGWAAGLLGAIGGAMAGVATAALMLILSHNAGRMPTVDRAGARPPTIGRAAGRSIALCLATFLVFGCQILAVSRGDWSTPVVAIGGAIVVALVLTLLTPWRELIQSVAAIDNIADGRAPSS